MPGRQQSFFEPNPAPWEQDDQSEQLVATVVFARGPQKSFDYSVPDALRPALSVGQRVRAPFGKQNRVLTGYCVDLQTRLCAGHPLKALEGVVEGRTLLNPGMLRLTAWMADYYLCSWGQVLEAVIPAGVRGQSGTRDTRLVSIANRVAAKLTELKLTPVQLRIVSYLAGREKPTPMRQVAAAAGCTLGPIQNLVKKGLVDLEHRRIDTRAEEAADGACREKSLQLNGDQRHALDAILESLRLGQHATVLVHGVTGSGKTEVYIQAIAEVLQYARQAIVLVPEISLTPQTEERFRSRFGSVAVLHSHMSDTERRRHWERIAAGQVSVVVGARSAIFAPTPHLGLIVLDEEHEGSFKQDRPPRYHARDVALQRARAEGIPLVLGSATPSLESWHRAQTGEYRLVSMPRRVFDRPLPAVGTIDLRVEFHDRRSRGAISRQLHLAMDKALKDNGQIILLLNRRGYSTHVQCMSCGLVCECPHCAIALTHHWQEQELVCHYCDYRCAPPTECPRCQFVGIHYRGLGTQRLEAEVQARFPRHRCLRMDADTMQKHGSHERALSLFRDGDVRILLGTQMIAKGLDFPNVTLVGVINADTALHLADFRAAERTFQLVTQVAGRTGRGEQGGRVLVQTFSPDHPAIAAAVRHDFEAFAREELPLRKAHDYPPLATMMRLVVRGPLESEAHALADQIALNLRAALANAAFRWRVLGPAPAPLAKLRGNFRFQIQLQGSSADELRQAIRQATADLKAPAATHWMVDVDPLDML